MSKIQEKTYLCGMELTMDIIGGKWKGVILWNLRNRTLRFSQLKRRLNGVTQKMLTQQLRELEEDGLINRKVFPQVPPKVEYSLTEYGKTIVPVLYGIYQWGIKYSMQFDVNLDIPNEIIDKIMKREL
ncbi:winged helix-turn-helix transcriptional regulator [Clostridium sp. ZS2-4]|uniref:winged helix-turn-helix transcriptional regulator n=1 Tax=Clostridium sp. ZS2-4 TaxID=2987703 RepID=UPI00227C925F|nr:helix-turn-helix domain-containing protein [Clostridium sp. ZS2-4]MCY6353744.1 helix-turn-helix domain-containing protein [Clostridium sp. ZS2-4]